MRTRERERERAIRQKQTKKNYEKKVGKNTKVGKIYMKDRSQNRIMLRDGREDDKQNKKTSKKGNKNKGKNYETIKNT